MLTCSAAGCNTNENTKINGKGITLFAFPNSDDESLIEKWEKNSRVKVKRYKNPDHFKLCELHFESDAFTSEDKNCLVPGAVPTIFEFDNKRRIKEEADSNTSDNPPPKQRKMQDGEEETQVEMIQEKNDAVQSALEASETRKPAEEPPTANGLTKENRSAFAKEIDSGKKVYRLIIRIDRVSDKSEIDEPNLAQRVEPNPLKSSLSLADNGRALKLCIKNGCKLMKTTLNSNPVFQCERCAKYYAVKGNSKKSTIWKCYICQEVLKTPDLLRYHIRNHFTCDICQAQCSTQISYDKHLRLHVSTDPLLPYKCHKCLSTFEVKAEVRQHCLEKHEKNRDQIKDVNKKASFKKGQVNLFQCEYCYVIFKKEQAYKSHVNLHTGNRDFDCVSCGKRFKTAKHLAAHQARHSDPLKLSCQICSEEFETEKEFETHTETHCKVNGEEHKCNICKKIFKNESLLGIHVRGHLSRAHRCPTCRKAFINKTTLRIHFKTHEKAASNTNGRKPISTKVYTCSLCLDTFNSPARLYKHVMSHLEQMHGEEGDDTVFDGIDELLESDDDILS